MRWIRRRRSGLEPLEERLRSIRPEAPSELLERLAARIRADAPQPVARPALRYRAALALVLTAGLVATAAAEGGLGYATTATNHTAAAISRVFSASTSRPDFVSQHVATPARVSNDNGKNDKGKNGDGDGDNPAGHQYVQFVYVCLVIDNLPHHKPPKIRTTLYLPKPAADELIDHGLARRGAC